MSNISNNINSYEDDRAPNSVRKFRAVFSARELTYMLNLVSKDSSDPASPDFVGNLIKKLSVLLYKVDIGAISPAHTETIKPSIEEKLGLTDSPETKRKKAFDRVQAGSKDTNDLALSDLHRYNHNMMQPEEKELYEQKYFQ